MDFWYEYSKLEILAKHGYLAQAKSRARFLLFKLQEHDAPKEHSALITDFCQLHQIELDDVQLPQTTPTDMPVDDYIRNRSPGISIVTACMNRNENLLVALRSWLEFDEVSEVLIVDWSSDSPVYLDIYKLGLNDPRVKVVRVENQPRWVLTYAFNIGFRLATYDTILKADADIILSRDFFDKNRLEQDTVITGDWRIAEENQAHINGFFYIRHSDLMKANGFNEFISSYGWDDDDLYGRLERVGVRRHTVDARTVYHLHHDDAQRLNHQAFEPGNAVEELEIDTFYKTMCNRFIANSMPVWGRRSGFLPVNLKQVSTNYLVAEQVRDGFHKVAPHVTADARYYAAVEMVSWRTSRRVYDLEKAKFWHYASQKKLDAMHRLDVSILVHGERPVAFGQPTWMLNCHLDAYQAYFWRTSFLDALNRLCHARGINIAIRINDRVFEECHERVQAFDRLYCFPVAEAYGHLEFVSPLKALERMSGANPPLHIGTNVSPESFAVDHLVELLDYRQPDTQKHIVQKERIYVDTQHGLGNRLRAIASAAAIAEKTDRELVVVWEPDHHCEASLQDLYCYNGAVIEKSFVADLSSDTDFYNYMEAEPNAAKDARVTLNEGKDLYVRTSCVINNHLSRWDDENRFLKQLKPHDDILDLIRPFDVKSCTAVHIRMEGDSGGANAHSYEKTENWSPESHDTIQFWRQKSHYANFIRRLELLFKEDKAHRIFLAADMAETYRALEETFGENVIYLARPSFDRSREQLKYALADAILLSRCESFIGSTWSSFSEIAMRLADGFKRVEMSGRDF